MNKDHSVNEKIRANIVDVVNVDGTMMKDVPFNLALNMAKDLGLDLVEVSHSTTSKNSICKFLDYGKLKYKEEKKKKPHKQVIKEIKFNFNIGEHDLEVKNKKVKIFLDKNYQIKYSIELRGRARNLVNDAKEKIDKCLEEFKDIANWIPVKIIPGGKVTRITTIISSNIKNVLK